MGLDVFVFCDCYEKGRLKSKPPDPDHAVFDLVPTKYRPLIQKGKILIENWHKFAQESEHKEGERSYAVWAFCTHAGSPFVTDQ